MTNDQHDTKIKTIHKLFKENTFPLIFKKEWQQVIN